MIPLWKERTCLYELILSTLLCHPGACTALYKSSSAALYFTAKFKPCNRTAWTGAWGSPLWKKRAKYNTHPFWRRIPWLRRTHIIYSGCRNGIYPTQCTGRRADPPWTSADAGSRVCPSSGICLFKSTPRSGSPVYLSYRGDTKPSGRPFKAEIWPGLLFSAAGQTEFHSGSGTEAGSCSDCPKRTSACLPPYCWPGRDSSLPTDLFW